MNGARSKPHTVPAVFRRETFRSGTFGNRPNSKPLSAFRQERGERRLAIR